MASPTFFLTCEKCGKADVCTIIRAISPLLGKWDEETRPFEPTQVAAICKSYLDRTIVDTLKGEVTSIE